MYLFCKVNFETPWNSSQIHPKINVSIFDTLSKKGCSYFWMENLIKATTKKSSNIHNYFLDSAQVRIVCQTVLFIEHETRNKFISIFHSDK